MTESELKSFQQYINSTKNAYAEWGEANIEAIFFRSENGISKIFSDNNFCDCHIGDIKPATEAEKKYLSKITFNGRKQYLFLTKQQYASQIKEEIPPILDDQAQILGVSVKYVSYKNAYKALKKRAACILEDGKSLILAPTLEEGYVCMNLLEKSSQSFIKSKKLGGAKPISRIEAWLMQKFYQLKYSKQAN